jgi:cardiolipin synthase
LRIGEIALWVAAGLTLITGYDYLRAGLRHMVEIDTEASARRQAEQRAEAERAANEERPASTRMRAGQAE